MATPNHYAFVLKETVHRPSSPRTSLWDMAGGRKAPAGSFSKDQEQLRARARSDARAWKVSGKCGLTELDEKRKGVHRSNRKTLRQLNDQNESERRQAPDEINYFVEHSTFLRTALHGVHRALKGHLELP